MIATTTRDPRRGRGDGRQSLLDRLPHTGHLLNIGGLSGISKKLLKESLASGRPRIDAGRLVAQKERLKQEGRISYCKVVKAGVA